MRYFLGDSLTKRPTWWLILVCIIKNRYEELQKVIPYLERRLNRELYLQQLRGWSLERKQRELDRRWEEFKKIRGEKL